MTNPEQNKYFKQWEHLLLKGKFGLEKENVRVNADGTLALSIHPDVFGDKGKNPYITTDFSESQIEMITPPLPSVAEALGFMETLHDVVTEHIGDEYLWPQSLPPLLPDEKEIPIARYTEQDKELEIYRETIARIYGKHRQLISGIHFNYSLPEELLEALLHTGAFGNTIKEVREQVYLKMVRNFMRYRWILVWLYGESPLAEDSFEVVSLKTGEKQPMKCGVSISLRTGPLGYRNKEEFVLDYYSIEAYEREIATIVEEGRLNSTKELYLPLRMKFLEKDNGAPSYLEVRLLDL
ncbi:MAG: bifunctional glutamate--cysteine ligase GshA/glutathione synthetase GshB, partial [Tannerellaceae bacterium]